MAEFDIEKSAGFLLAKAHQRLYAYFREEFCDYPITPPQFALLAFLWRRDGLSQRELSERTEVDRTTIGGLVDRLEKAGLVSRRPNPADRRAYLVYLTEAGKGLEKELTPLALRIRERVTGGLAPGEYEKLCELLEKLRG
jgi:DNA-binding MarR family transcriptional regulator